MLRALRDARSFRIYNGAAARSCRRAFLKGHIDSLFSAIADYLHSDCPVGLARERLNQGPYAVDFFVVNGDDHISRLEPRLRRCAVFFNRSDQHTLAVFHTKELS